VVIPDVITVQQLAQALQMESEEVIERLANDAYSTPVALIDPDDAELLVLEAGKIVQRLTDGFAEAEPERAEVPLESFLPRPAVVAVLGHVDHGKTSLLDSLRQDQTGLAAAEAGGITQKIGAFSVAVEGGASLTFLDTPGHEAFGAMRARGAHATDISVLVVAADDGVMPQTIEAIGLARKAETPLVVAITKCDKPEANIQRVKEQLLQYEVVSDELGGEDLFVEVSAVTGQGLEELQDAIALQAEMLNLEAPVEGVNAEGIIIEARPDKGVGVVSTVLLQAGTLQPGAIVVAGSSWGKVRRLVDEQGVSISELYPGAAAEVVGFKEVPPVGVEMLQVDSERIAKQVAERRKQREDSLRMHARTVAAQRLAGDGMRALRLVIKADSQGSLQALCNILEQQVNDEVGVHVVHHGVGAISPSDIDKAVAAEAGIIGFSVPLPGKVAQQAKLRDIPVYRHEVVYNILDHVREDLGTLLEPEVVQDYQGAADILEVFSINGRRRRDGQSNAAGCKVIDGVLGDAHIFKVIRGEEQEVAHCGTVKEIRHFKDRVTSISSGHECGIMLEGFDQFKVGDRVEAVLERQVPRVFICGDQDS